MTKILTRRDALKLGGGLLAAGAVAGSGPAFAQSFPSQPINMVVPFNTGGYNDRLARAFAPFLQKELGQPIVIVNRGGSGGLLGHAYFMQQPDDGHTMLCTSAAPYIPLNIALQKASFKITDFQMLNLPSRDYSLLATASGSSLKDIKDVVAKLKANPASLSIGIQPNSADYVNLFLFADANGIDRTKLRLVTYNGGGPARNAVAGGVVDIGVVGGEGFLNIASKITPLLVFDDERQPPFDAAPTVVDVVGKSAEFVAGSQRGWAVHTSLMTKHPDRYKRIADAVEKASKDPECIKTLTNQKLATKWYGPEQSNAALRKTSDVMQKHIALLKKS